MASASHTVSTSARHSSANWDKSLDRLQSTKRSAHIPRKLLGNNNLSSGRSAM
eukprot:CAMPEP_0197862682 /NCGR_PEP_ID=MMETSP1438-20131217/39648_1 /TAXON_ID=1461541 /ORGANISM="Pterosperma sp., Strain CCMP1384" /LENGTH=52 /DNA_ID=CAMNT_0043480329 /DNA_START=117 /DNA_END=272 /DNA_ORIENTATION=+